MADFPGESLMINAFAALYEANVTYDLRTPAEAFINSGMTTTVYYKMLGFDSVVPTAETVWTVTGTPDTTGAFSGNPTINAATIREIASWTVSG